VDSGIETLISFPEHIADERLLLLTLRQYLLLFNYTLFTLLISSVLLKFSSTGRKGRGMSASSRGMTDP
jgi:hypothetical protein